MFRKILHVEFKCEKAEVYRNMKDSGEIDLLLQQLYFIVHLLSINIDFFDASCNNEGGGGGREASHA